MEEGTKESQLSMTQEELWNNSGSYLKFEDSWVQEGQRNYI